MDTEQKAERARAILRDLRGPLDRIRERHIAAFENSDFGQPEAREQAWAMLQAIKELEVEIHEDIDSEAIKQKKVGKRD